MAFFIRLTLLLFSFCFIFSAGLLPARAAEKIKYGQWQSSENNLEKLINELDLIIEEGTKSRAAHPGFLQDLNTIIDTYRTPKKLVFFADDFADGNYTENPAWIVSRGAFSIDSFGSLHSSIYASKPVTAQESGSESGEDRNLKILLGVLNELTKDEANVTEKEETPETRAVISSTVTITNDFILEYTFRSDSDWGSTSIGVILGDDPQSGYHLVYQASPGENRPMQLIKYRYGKPYIIDEVYENSPNLDDGADHSIRFSRALNGDMVVTVDGLEMMRTADLSHREDFSGVMIANNGGSYSYDNIQFYVEQ